MFLKLSPCLGHPCAIGKVLLCALLMLLVSGGAPEGELCRAWMDWMGAPAGVFQCPKRLDGAEAKFCCGTCNSPYCCSTRDDRLDQERCPTDRLLKTVTSEGPGQQVTSTTPFLAGEGTVTPDSPRQGANTLLLTEDWTTALVPVRHATSWTTVIWVIFATVGISCACCAYSYCCAKYKVVLRRPRQHRQDARVDMIELPERLPSIHPPSPPPRAPRRSCLPPPPPPLPPPYSSRESCMSPIHDPSLPPLPKASRFSPSDLPPPYSTSGSRAPPPDPSLPHRPRAFCMSPASGPSLPRPPRTSRLSPPRSPRASRMLPPPYYDPPPYSLVDPLGSWLLRPALDSAPVAQVGCANTGYRDDVEATALSSAASARAAHDGSTSGHAGQGAEAALPGPVKEEDDDLEM
ncbi:protein shisa-5-like [Rhineura floridana]|uniref:protein shisa-5-like n=1 Tax=Rhineura floridana TaxID=261503 RepID=UPI002AC887AA|nr:protein shisa-5-like [Rhineura floridana]